jgi:hypothetical protein
MPGDRKDRLQQRVVEVFKFAAGADLRLAGTASGDLPDLQT